jgi:hypothetical protein
MIQPKRLSEIEAIKKLKNIAQKRLEDVAKVNLKQYGEFSPECKELKLNF